MSDSVEVTNVSELMIASRRASEIYRNFHDPSGGVPKQIQLLIRASKQLNDIVTESEGLLRQCNRIYPGSRTLMRRLEETDSFVQRHCSVTERESDGSDSPPGRYLFWLQSKYELGEPRAKRIYDGLKIETQRLISFIFIVAL
jgi:hypothetical protein